MNIFFATTIKIVEDIHNKHFFQQTIDNKLVICIIKVSILNYNYFIIRVFVMQTELEFPDIGIGPNEEITISFWHIEEDEEFEEGDDILEVSTKISTFNVPAPDKGRLIEILVQEGDVVTTGDTIAIIESKV